MTNSPNTKNNIMKCMLFLLAVLPSAILFAQPDMALAPHPPLQRNGAWFTPNDANRINGLAVGFQALNVHNEGLEINGVNAGIGFVGFFAIPYCLDWSLSGSAKRRAMNFLNPDSANLALQEQTVIRGLSMSMGGEMAVTVKGLNLSGGITLGKELVGVSVTGYFTCVQSFTGICFSGVHNVSTKGTGLQIGLFNRCDKLKGLQIGLWNRSGKRSLPLLNWGF